MLATMLYAPGDVRCEEVAEPRILKPTDAIIKLSASCVCGSDLWPFRGANDVAAPMAMGHEYCGIVVEVGSLEIPLADVAEGYRAMDERRAIKTLLRL